VGCQVQVDLPLECKNEENGRDGDAEIMGKNEEIRGILTKLQLAQE